MAVGPEKSFQSQNAIWKLKSLAPGSNPMCDLELQAQQLATDYELLPHRLHKGEDVQV